MTQKLHILLVEDSEDDATFIARELKRGGYEPEFRRVETEEDFDAALAKGGWDVIIADYNLPRFSGAAALEGLRKTGADIPFIIVSGAVGEETAVAMMKRGAHDFILKSGLARLVPAVAREMRDAQVRRERRDAVEELKTSREQLRALAAHLQSVVEEERKRITREIHDEMGQSLTGLKMDLAWVRARLQSNSSPAGREPVFDKLNAMGAVLDGTANLVRKLCTELRPGILDDLGLTAAIEWQAREFERRTGIACLTKLELGETVVDAGQSTALFRIFQEILTNVARHAQATRVDVLLKPAEDFVLLKVTDNGRGIREGERAGKKSLGLLGMRERAHILGGEVEIHGAPGKGTTVSVKVPLPRPDRQASEPTQPEKLKT